MGKRKVHDQNSSSGKRKAGERKKKSLPSSSTLHLSAGEKTKAKEEVLLPGASTSQPRVGSDGEELESPEDYKIGGYCPLNAGDILNGRYQAVRKLGWGAFSTVWMAFDTEEKCNVALKITKADADSTAGAAVEIEMLKTAREVDPANIGSQKVVQLLDDFAFTSENGTHIVIVLEIVECSLWKLLLRSEAQGHKGLPLKQVQSICYQILLGLKYLHEKCKMIHTDIKPENVLVTVNYERAKIMAPDGEVGKNINVKENGPFTNSLSKNKSIRNRKTIGNQDKNEDSAVLQIAPDITNPNCSIQVKIGDLGNSRWLNDKKIEIQTINYRALEVFIGADYGPLVDVWSVGCMAYELATGEELFAYCPNGKIPPEEYHLIQVSEVLGPIPASIFKKGKHWKKYFTKDGSFVNFTLKQEQRCSLITLLTKDHSWSDQEARNFESFLLPMLSYDPSKRASADDALRHPFLSAFSNLPPKPSTNKSAKVNSGKSKNMKKKKRKTLMRHHDN